MYALLLLLCVLVYCLLCTGCLVACFLDCLLAWLLWLLLLLCMLSLFLLLFNGGGCLVSFKFGLLGWLYALQMLCAWFVYWLLIGAYVSLFGALNGLISYIKGGLRGLYGLLCGFMIQILADFWLFFSVYLGFCSVFG